MGLSARELISKTSSAERVYHICLDGRLRSELDAAQADLVDAKQAGSATMAGDPRIAELTVQVEDLEKQMADATVAFRFRGISHWRFKEIQRRFPTEERNMTWDVDAGSPTLISECLVDPQLTPDEVRELLDHGNQRLADEFVSAAMIVCQQGNEVPKSVRSSASTRGPASN